MHKILVKFCGMRRQPDIQLAASLNAHICGFIFHKKSPRYIEPEEVAALHTQGMLRAGIFTAADADEICRIMHTARLDLAQLHGSQSAACARAIGAKRVIRVLWPERYASIEELRAQAENYADSCAWYLLDAGQSGGGSGRGLEWANLAPLKLPHNWFLAGGLSSSNLALAYAQCQPDGMDFNTGIEDAPGLKSEEKMRAVFAELAKLRQNI